MTATRPRNPRLIASACIALALVATTAAVRTPRPASLAKQAAPVVAVQAPGPAVAAQSPVAATPVVSADAPRPASKSAPAPAPVPSADVATSVPTVSITPRPGAREIPIEVIRALIKQYYPSLLTETGGNATVAFVFDANGNYVTSREDVVWPNGDGTVRRRMTTQLGSAALSDSLETIAMAKRARGAASSDAMADSVAVGERLAVLKAALDSLRQLKLMTAGVDNADAPVARGRGARVGGGSPPSATPDILSNLVNPDLIQSIEVRKFAPGMLVVGPIGVIVVQLKPTRSE